MRVLIHGPDNHHWREALKTRLPNATLLTSDDDGEQPADYLVVWKPPASLFNAQDHRLKAILNLGAGVDALLANPALPRGVPILKLRDAGMADTMADYVHYGVLHFHRNFDTYLAQEQHSSWQEQLLEAKSAWPVGVLGLGAIGRHVAGHLAAQGYPVHGWSRSPKVLDNVRCHHGDDGLDDVLSHARILINLLPGTSATQGLLDAQKLDRLPRGAALINPGRGSTLDIDALLTAIESGQLRGALLDVFPEEPLPQDSPLWTHPRIRITPHIAAPTPVEQAADQIAGNILRLERGDAIEAVQVEAGY
ncbi:2-hydroxyacid dehydrogenase [Phytohalomonas tamaricis]|uniref:2-hydroxyacid dehydrogenase n=1 Tax=Phytohalomonas tamaricis TaxID=2081032 RepID=UPI000D0AC593|nr:glyoxylate/hydroxypyruvate reductase A [Phytohalomonas tamaricis]